MKTNSEIERSIRDDPSVKQFINSLRFISSGTGITLDSLRLEDALIRLCSLIWLDGMKEGLEESRRALQGD